MKLEFTSIFPPEGGNLRPLSDIIGEKKNFQQWIGIAPFAAHEGKILPTEKTEELIKEISRRHPSCRIFLFGGGEKEHAVLNAWCERYNNCTNASQALHSLKEEMVVMSHLDVMVSMDSGNMHLAAISGTRVISVWGETHPYAGFLGWNQRPEDCIQADLPCRPCSIYGNKPCQRGDYACLTSIDPITIADKVDWILN